MEEKKVVLGLSGGVDSAASALLLKEMGYTIHGVFLRGPGADEGSAARAAEELGISFEVIDIAAELDEKVICPFVESYLRGETPNPCIICNPAVKFRRLFEAADRIGAEKVATGHYAVVRDGKLFASPSPKDQSYMLYRLPPEMIARCIFPLGELQDKSETRALAASGGLSSSKTGDSMEICFIPDDDHGKFIEDRGAKPLMGNFVDEDGKILGPHLGIHRYTVGQRRGLGIAASGRLYVRHIDIESGDIVLSLIDPKATTVRIGSICLTDPDVAGQESVPCRVKVRHTKKFETGVFYPAQGRIEFEESVRALSPGQSAVCYAEDGHVLGGGFILRENN
ncbi:MAG: tRNA 2-thiouridine(34) synthase MnmA [Clostridia bacterium]|nr:tRNA 2-thiouridine(34) synthase MnmA [Clostridia bacterium]